MDETNTQVIRLSPFDNVVVARTGVSAGVATIICFTTGRGSVFGCKPVPVIKLATNTALYERMEGDMDIDCGPIVKGEATVEEMGAEVPKRPMFFLKPPSSLVGHEDVIIIPRGAERVDYEGELALVIKDKVKDVP